MGLIVSFDSIMRNSYYEGTSKMISLSLEIGKLLGTIDANYLRKPVEDAIKNSQ